MKRGIFLLFLGIVLGLILLWGDAAGFFIPWQKKLFSFSSTLYTPTPSPDFASYILETKIAALEEENAVLKKILKIAENTKLALVAPVLGFTLQSRTILLVGKGQKDGVEKGQAVLTPEGALVGKIITVHPSLSLVRLITNSQSKFSGVIMSASSPLSGVVEGVGGLGLQLTLIPLQEPVAIGDLVMTAGQEIGISRGLPIGRVENIMEMPGTPLKQAILSPLADLDQLLFVVILPEGEGLSP